MQQREQTVIEKKAQDYVNSISFVDQFNVDQLKLNCIEDFTAGYKQALIDLQEYSPDQIQAMKKGLKDIIERIEYSSLGISLDIRDIATNALKSIYTTQKDIKK